MDVCLVEQELWVPLAFGKTWLRCSSDDFVSFPSMSWQVAFGPSKRSFPSFMASYSRGLLAVQTVLSVGCQPNGPSLASSCGVPLPHGRLAHPCPVESWECRPPLPCPCMAILLSCCQADLHQVTKVRLERWVQACP